MYKYVLCVLIDKLVQQTKYFADLLWVYRILFRELVQVLHFSLVNTYTNKDPGEDHLKIKHLDLFCQNRTFLISSFCKLVIVSLHFCLVFSSLSPTPVVPSMWQPKGGRNQQHRSRRQYEERKGYSGGQVGIQL